MHSRGCCSSSGKLCLACNRPHLLVCRILGVLRGRIGSGGHFCHFLPAHWTLLTHLCHFLSSSPQLPKCILPLESYISKVLQNLFWCLIQVILLGFFLGGPYCHLWFSSVGFTFGCASPTCDVQLCGTPVMQWNTTWYNLLLFLFFFFWKHNSRPDLTSNRHAQVKFIGRQWNTTWYNLLLFCSCSSFFGSTTADLSWQAIGTPEVKLIVRWWYDLFYHFNKMELHLTGPAVEQPILPFWTILVNLHSLYALYICLLFSFCINYLEKDLYLFIMLQFPFIRLPRKYYS